MANNSHMIPEIIKNIAWKLSPENKIVNSNERWVAVSHLEVIRDYCQSAIDFYNKQNKRK